MINGDIFFKNNFKFTILGNELFKILRISEI